LLKELTAELIDYVETEFFTSAFFELLQASFEDDLVEGLTDELIKKPDLFTTIPNKDP